MSGSQWSENICADEGGLGLTERSAERRAELELSTVFWPQRRPGRTEVVRRDRRRKWRDSTGADLRFSGIWAKRANGLTGAAIGASGTRKCPRRAARKGWLVCGHFRSNNGRRGQHAKIDYAWGVRGRCASGLSGTGATNRATETHSLRPYHSSRRTRNRSHGSERHYQNSEIKELKDSF